jgi:hypothetical protein
LLNTTSILITEFKINNAVYGYCLIKERFTCPTSDGFYGIDGQCTANYYACVGGAAYPQVNIENKFSEQLLKTWQQPSFFIIPIFYPHYFKNVSPRHVRELAMFLIL